MDTPARHATELSLVDRARRRELHAFSALVRIHRPHVRVFLGTHVRDQHVVDDLAQDVFMRAFDSLPTLREPSSFRSWLLGIAHHRALEFLRERARISAGHGAVEALFDQAQIALLESEDEDARRGIELDCLKACLRRLPEGGARLIREHYFRGRPINQLAEEEGKTAGAMRVALFRLREGLRDCVRQRMNMRGER